MSMKTRNVGEVIDKLAFRREDDDYPYGTAIYKINNHSSFLRFSQEWDFQRRRVYLDEYRDVK